MAESDKRYYIHQIALLDTKLDQQRITWLGCKGQIKDVVMVSIDVLLDERFRLMKLRDAA